uniref:Uncharacterized protein n=1 Tax=Rhizophagus irregularis (strain DAOM 181602 / DAOM 197198 / MUCL 43194) TaxID=747089 RepID=U9T6M3_RHIID
MNHQQFLYDIAMSIFNFITDYFLEGDHVIMDYCALHPLENDKSGDPDEKLGEMENFFSEKETEETRKKLRELTSGDDDYLKKNLRLQGSKIYESHKESEFASYWRTDHTMYLQLPTRNVI